MMKTEDMIRELKKVKKKYEGKHVFTGEVNIASMCYDVIKKLEELQEKENLNCGECSRRKFYQEGFRDGTIWANNNWYMINDGVMPKELGYDWVKIQVKERYTDFLWVPRIAEFRKGKWWLIGNDNDDIMLDEDKLDVDVIAWQAIRPFPMQES